MNDQAILTEETKRRAYVARRLAAEPKIAVPSTRAEYDALPVETKRALREQRPDWSVSSLPAEPTEYERAQAIMLERAEAEGLPLTFEHWRAVPAADRERLTAECGRWYTPRLLPQSTPTESGYVRALREAAEGEQRVKDAMTKAAEHRPWFQPAAAKPDDHSVRAYPSTFAEWDALTIEQKRGLRSNFPGRRPRDLPGYRGTR